MPGGSSAVKEEPIKVGSPPSLLGAAGGALGGAGKDDQLLHQPTPLLLKECADRRNTVY